MRMLLLSAVLALTGCMGHAQATQAQLESIAGAPVPAP
jgi:hypothetical protein